MSAELKCCANECDVEVSETIAKFCKENYDGKIYCYAHQRGQPKVKTHGEGDKDKKDWKDDIIDFETLLNDAHTKFKDRLSISTEIIEKDMEKEFAIVKAAVRITPNAKDREFEIPRYFEAHGDATQKNCKSDMIKPHFIRMAETRAIARALRWATNNATTAEEEKA